MDNKGFEEIMGSESCGNRNENGGLFLTFAMPTTWSSETAYFCIKKYTRSHGYHPTGLRRIRSITSQSPGFRRAIEDVRVYSSADIGSDHELVMAKIRLKLCRQIPGRGKEQRCEAM